MKKCRTCIFVAITSFIFIMLGIVFTVAEALEYSIVDDFDADTLSKKVLAYDMTLNNKVTQIDTTSCEAFIVYDNSIKTGNIKLVITYYDELIKINEFSVKQSNNDIIYVEADETEDGLRVARELARATVEGLKQKQIYNYTEAIRPHIKVVINEADKESVKIRN